MQYLFGPKSLKEAINNKKVFIKKVYLSDNKSELIKILKDNKIPFETNLNNNFFNKWDFKLNHQNCVAEIETNNLFSNVKDFLNSKQNQESSSQKKLILVLDELNDPRNFGSIIRTSYALGVQAIIYKKNNQTQINELIVKTSMGAAYFIPLIRVANLTNSINILKENGYWTYCSTLSNESVNYNSITYDRNTVLIVGSESNGVSKHLVDNSDFKIKIPMANDYDSLNVSVATGILVSKILN